jgi:predicted deacetylase
VIHPRDGFASPVRPACNKAPAGLLVALHDVTPAHAERLERAERLLTSLGIPAVTYLFVPDFHAHAPAHAYPDFGAWCRAPRPFAVQWFVHGYFHREGVGRARHLAATRPAEWFGRTFLTAGEAEFLLLRGELLDERLRDGVQSFLTCFGRAPAGFVAPAWLYNEELMAALTRLQFVYSESHFHVFDLRRALAVPAPVMTWASRSAAHRAGSRAAVSIARRWWARRPLVRIAMHPLDFEHPRIVDGIARTLDALRSDHRVVTYEEACAQVAST